MDAPAVMPAPSRTLRPWRSGTDVILTGVAGGLGERLGLDPNLIRAAFAILGLAGGFGVIAYILLWLASTPADARRPVPPPLAVWRQVAAVACLTFGMLIAVREAGWWFGDRLVWPLALAALGSSLMWVRGDPSAPSATALGAGRAGVARIAIGALLIFAGMGAVLAGDTAFALGRLLDVIFPVLVTITGGTLVFAPWLYRLAQQATAERRERIRSQERAEMAAHLHDSVLQTLSLIQRARSAKEMTSLARVQERELRAWLYAKSKDAGVATLDSAIDAMAGRVEQLHQVNVETVVVGDTRLDGRVRALVDACGEAATNAARHSGSATISVYAEVQDDSVIAYVRDQGSGFDPAKVPFDRRGIADSIVGRIRRHGGDATITSAPGTGTEVQLRIPLKP